MKNIENSIYYNRIVIIENGKTMQYDTMHHYDVPKIIANYLTNGVYCRSNQCNFAKKTLADQAAPANSLDRLHDDHGPCHHVKKKMLRSFSLDRSRTVSTQHS